MLSTGKHPTVLSIDPGGTTGIAMYTPDITGEGKYITMTATTADELWRLVTMTPWDAVVCERFTTSGRISKHGVNTIELVGGVRALCGFAKIQFVYRTPQNRRAFQGLAKLTLQKIDHVVHEEDALAHLLAWLNAQGVKVDARYDNLSY